MSGAPKRSLPPCLPHQPSSAESQLTYATSLSVKSPRPSSSDSDGHPAHSAHSAPGVGSGIGETEHNVAMDMEIQQVPWWNRRSRLERRFFVTAVFLGCVAIALAVGLVSVAYGSGNQAGGADQTAAAGAFTQSKFHQRPCTNGHYVGGEGGDDAARPAGDFCMTPSCVRTAAELITNMDKTTEPCEDFYQFSCGGFIERTSIPDDRTRMSSFSVLGDELLTQVSMLFFLCCCFFTSLKTKLAQIVTIDCRCFQQLGTGTFPTDFSNKLFLEQSILSQVHLARNGKYVGFVVRQERK